MAKQIFAAEIHHESLPLELRRHQLFDKSKSKDHLLAVSVLVDESFFIVTQNRAAFYIINEDIKPLVEFFSSSGSLASFVQYFHNTEESIHHLFATSAGLCSSVKGEHEVLLSFEEARKLAIECESAGLLLDNLLGEAICVGKKIRTESGIDKFCGSVIDAGFILAEDRLKDFVNSNFLIVGTGAISRMAAEWLFFAGAKNVYITGQEIRSVKELAARYMAHACSMEHITHYFLQADVVIGGAHGPVDLLPFSATVPSKPIQDYPLIKKRIILDMGVPRNFDDVLRTYNGIEMYSLDDLKTMQYTPLDSFGGIGGAWDLVMEETRRFVTLLKQLGTSPVRATHWSTFIDVKEDDLTWLLPKLSDVSESDKEIKEKFTRTLIKTYSKRHPSNTGGVASVKSKQNVEEIIRYYRKYNIDLHTFSN